MKSKAKNYGNLWHRILARMNNASRNWLFFCVNLVRVEVDRLNVAIFLSSCSVLLKWIISFAANWVVASNFPCLRSVLKKNSLWFLCLSPAERVRIDWFALFHFDRCRRRERREDSREVRATKNRWDSLRCDTIINWLWRIWQVAIRQKWVRKKTVITHRKFPAQWIQW